jgi:hypothetical protein
LQLILELQYADIDEKDHKNISDTETIKWIG